MESKKIYLIRHGQTDYNLKGIVQGSGVDSDLNDTGRKQAMLFYEAYREIPFKKIYTSALKRSVQSVQGFIDSGIPHESYEGLNEINWGNKDGKIVTINDNNYYREMVKRWREGELHVKPEGGESPLELEEKQKKVLELIISRKEEDVILMCMHGRAIRILLSSILHQDLRLMDNFLHDNLGLYILHYDYKTGYSVEKTNCKQHLL